MDLFTGVGVALVTLLDDAGGVDAAATGSLAALSLIHISEPTRPY